MVSETFARIRGHLGMSRVTLGPTQFPYCNDRILHHTNDRTLHHTSETSVSTALVSVLARFVTVSLSVPAFFHGTKKQTRRPCEYRKTISCNEAWRRVGARHKGLRAEEFDYQVKNHV